MATTKKSKSKGKLVYLDDDVVKVGFPDANGKLRVETTLCWGDQIRVLPKRDGKFPVLMSRWEKLPPKGDELKPTFRFVQREGFISGKAKFRDTSVLKVRYVDVGQGDASMIESPKGRVVLLDGGEEKHVLNYVRAAWAHVIRKGPLHCDAIVVSHGDADHFAGLIVLANAARKDGSPVVTADYVFHNGLVKTGKKPDTKAFGATKKVGKQLYVTELQDDLLKVPDTKMSKQFNDWKKALARLKKANGKMKVSRLAYGDDDAFAFLQNEKINVQVLGPIVDDVGGKDALPFLHGNSASHTVNGHSIVLKLTYGNVRFLFGADLNEDSEERLLVRAREDEVALASEVLKVPHHGSHDFSARMLEAVSPVVSVVSSGDESKKKEYIHPRAGLVGALGKYSRGGVEKPLIYVTEMVAFFRRIGAGQVSTITRSKGKTPKPKLGKPETVQNVYEKSAFGIVHVRTDGRRVLVATPSGKDDKRESYAFVVDERGDVTFEEPSVI